MTDAANRDAETVDALVIGTGQAGTPLAGALAADGRRTAIVERGRVGGTCVLRGCTPTKTMVASARVAYLARRASDYGVRTGPVSVDLEAVRARKRDIVDAWSESERKHLEETEGLELVFGEARFVAERTVEVALREGGTRRLSAPWVFLDTGSRPAVPPLDGLEDVPYLDSTSIMELGEVPDHLVVLGGGPLGLEFAQMFRRFGADVTIVERGSRLAAGEDEDVSDALREILEEDGLRVLTDADASAVRGGDGSGPIRLSVRGPDGPVELAGSHLLVAAGRAPNTDRLDLAATGLATDERGHVQVNGRLETTVEGIWALGDITGHPAFTHTSYDDYRIVKANLLDGGDRSTEDRILTYTVFTDPQLGRVGSTERDARNEFREVRVAKLPMSRVARAIETDETRGFMKAVVDGGSGRILGAAVLGIDGGEVAAMLKLAMMGGLRAADLHHAVLAHPTLAESLNNLFEEALT